MNSPGRRFMLFLWYLIWTGIALQIAFRVALPIALGVLAVGVAAGLVIGLGHIGAVLGGWQSDTKVLAPAGVAGGGLPGRVRAEHVRRDRAWPQYFAVQLRLDMASAIRSVGRTMEAMGDRATGPLRQHTFRKIIYLWPLLAVGAAGLAGVTLGIGAVLLIVLLVAVVLGSLAWTAGLLMVGVLRGIDRAWQFVFRADGSCSRCYAITRLPAYRCAGAHSQQDRIAHDDLHRDIRPGRLGILWRRCSCGRLLPTTVLRASRRMQACCPQCIEPLHAGAAVDTDARIPVFGAASSGKTHLIVAAVVALLEPSNAATLIDEYSRRRYDEYAALVRNDASVPKTDAASQPIAVTLRLAEGRRGTLLHLFDAAGEALADPALNAGYSYLDTARTLLFVVDPFSIPEIRDQMAATHAAAFAAANPAQTDPEASYQATVTRLRLSGVSTERQTLAFVVSKRDLLATLPLPAELPATSAEIREWLIRAGLDNLVLCAERDFGRVRYFAVSSKDRSADGPLAPIRWLLAEHRFRMPMARGKDAATSPDPNGSRPSRNPLPGAEPA